jgi:hypothetical protein
MRLRFVKILLCAVAVLGASGACSKTNNVDQSKDTTNNIIKGVVDEEGGPVGDRNVVGAFIPARALDQSEEITIRVAEPGEYPELPETAVGDVYSFEPHGLEFNTEVDVYLPLPEGEVATDYAIAHASVDGAWDPVNRAENKSKTSVRARTLSFSFFVLVKSLPPDTSNGGGAGVGVAQPPGSAGSLSMGGSGPSGSAGSPAMGGKSGDGGNGAGGVPGGGGSGTNQCVAADMIDPGTCDAKGEVATKAPPINFPAIDGFAVQNQQGNPEVTLIFTPYLGACNVALGMGGSKVDQSHMPAGLPDKGLLRVQLVLDSTAGETKVVPDVYPRAAKEEDRIDAMYFANDSTCKPSEQVPQGGPVGKTITITEIDDEHVAGTVEFLAPGANVPFTADFDLPMCPLADTTQTLCCIE